MKNKAKKHRKNKPGGGRPLLGETPRVSRLFTLEEANAQEFHRLCAEKSLKMSSIVNSLIHQWVIANQNSTEPLP